MYCDWCSSLAECRGEGEEGENDQGLEGAQDSSTAPRSVVEPLHVVTCHSPCAVESSVRLRLKLIKSKAVEVIAYLKV